MKGQIKRPIVWVGGSGNPGGVTARALESMGYPLHWEPLTEETAGKLATLSPLLVVVEAARITAPIRRLLSSVRQLKQSQRLVVFLLRDREDSRLEELADGCLVRGRTLGHQIRAAVSALEAVETKEKEQGAGARERIEHMEQELHRLRNLVVRDDLTCLYNLRFFNTSLDTEHLRATRFGRHYSLIFLDVDGLKEVNTRHGHLAGGQVLRQLGDYLNKSLRRIDIPARVGGDEFVIICPETTKLSARILADRIRQGIEELRMHEENERPGITASIGVASFPEDGDLPGEILERADQALYEAKAKGKNCVCCWGEFPANETANRPRGLVHGDVVPDELAETHR